MDDHSVVREGLAAFFDARPEPHIAGQCADGFAAVEMIKSLTPDFAIIDLQLPKLHGLEVFCKVRETNSVCKLVVLTINRDEKMVRDALRAGANGYVLKGRSGAPPARRHQLQNSGVCISPLLRPDDPLSATPGPRDSDDDPDEGGGVQSTLAETATSPTQSRGRWSRPPARRKSRRRRGHAPEELADAKGASKWEAMESARVLTRGGLTKSFGDPAKRANP